MTYKWILHDRLVRKKGGSQRNDMNAEYKGDKKKQINDFSERGFYISYLNILHSPPSKDNLLKMTHIIYGNKTNVHLKKQWHV